MRRSQFGALYDGPFFAITRPDAESNVTSAFRRNHRQVKGEGTQPVLLAHGFGTDQTAWQRSSGGCGLLALDALYATMSSNYLAWVSGYAGLGMEKPERQELTRTLGALRPEIAVVVELQIYHSDYQGELPRLYTPKLVIQNRHDIAVLVEVGEYLACRLPQAMRAVIDTLGHFPHMSAPAAVNAAIESFVH